MHLFSIWHSIASLRCQNRVFLLFAHLFSPFVFKCKFLSERKGKVMTCWDLQARSLFCVNKMMGVKMLVSSQAMQESNQLIARLGSLVTLLENCTLMISLYF